MSEKSFDTCVVGLRSGYDMRRTEAIGGKILALSSGLVLAAMSLWCYQTWGVEACVFPALMAICAIVFAND